MSVVSCLDRLPVPTILYWEVFVLLTGGFFLKTSKTFYSGNSLVTKGLILTIFWMLSLYRRK